MESHELIGMILGQTVIPKDTNQRCHRLLNVGLQTEEIKELADLVSKFAKLYDGLNDAYARLRALEECAMDVLPPQTKSRSLV